MQEPRVCRKSELGETVQLSVDLIHRVKSSDERFRFEWWADGRRIRKSKGIQGSDTNTLSIDEFENKHKGTYECVISTTSPPTMSVSAKIDLDFAHGMLHDVPLTQKFSLKLSFAAPPKLLTPDMTDEEFLLFLNMNKIPYKVCNKLQGERQDAVVTCKLVATVLYFLIGVIILFTAVHIDEEITAAEFNLHSFESWSQDSDLDLKSRERDALRNLIGMLECTYSWFIVVITSFCCSFISLRQYFCEYSS